MLRRTLAVLIALVLLAGVWIRSPAQVESHDQQLALTPLVLPAGCCTAGAFQLAQVWQMTSANTYFGGYSALLQPAPGQLLAFSDRGYYLRFAVPGAAPSAVRFGPMLDDAARLKDSRDVESATRDPQTGQIWLGLEGRDAFARHRADLVREDFRQIAQMKDWPQNQGPEAMLRLRDGRFVVLCECTPGWLHGGMHPALLFSGDPMGDGAVQPFTFAGVVGYRPTDMAQLPDGRVLILARQLVWPVPARFAVKILIADPVAIAQGGTWQAREVADLTDPWPLDNYEGLAIEQQADGQLFAWIVSDDNGAVTQRTLLLKVRIDPAKL